MAQIDKRIPKTCKECGSTGSLTQSDREGLLACTLCGAYHEYLPRS
ncbi:hypothetical protein LCGC14_2743430 [marine sediment metagenome]|uniref:Uncharacterized protein n=1 Tax=marine sediment metagenome TaxID=412755 RepID=A0A0F8ZR20_9ZZZZ